MSLYRTTVDPAVKNSSQTLALQLAGPDRDVLDVGCASGDLAEALVRQGCRVSGVEYDAEAAEEARPHLQQLVVGDVNEIDLVESFGPASFDDVVFGDVLEHLVDPVGVVQAALPLLRPGGSIIISVPNVAHGALRLALLQGRWRYTPEGLLDATHLRFFTRESFFAMLHDLGLAVTDFYATILDPLGCEVDIDDAALPGTIVDWVRRQPDAMTYQFVVRAVIGNPDAPVPEMIPAVDIPVVDDIHAERARREPDGVGLTEQNDALVAEVVDLTHRVLTLRDHAIGAAAATGTAQLEAEAARQRTHQTQCELNSALKELDDARRQITAMRGSRSWRLGNALVRPIARASGAVKGR